MSQVKTCPKCNVEKILDIDYYKNKRTKSGYQSYCKDCTKFAARTYNNTAEGRRKLYDIQTKRYKRNKENNTLKSYYKPVPEDQKKKCGRKHISAQELERREKQKQYDKQIKECNKLIYKINNMMSDTEMVINELDEKVKNMMKETEIVIDELDEKVKYINDTF